MLLTSECCLSLSVYSLFDESLSVVDSFKPIYSFDKGSAGQTMYRLGLLVALVAFIVWAASQPTEFDGLLEAQKEFVDDLYSGRRGVVGDGGGLTGCCGVVCCLFLQGNC